VHYQVSVGGCAELELAWRPRAGALSYSQSWRTCGHHDPSARNWMVVSAAWITAFESLRCVIKKSYVFCGRGANGKG